MNEIERLREKIKTLREKIKTLKILVVDDEEHIREKTALFMEKFFDKVHSAEDGKIALKMFKENSSYDIILTDLQMPHMTGDQLVKEIRAIDSGIFIVVMTGTPDLDDELVRLCNICLDKPVGIDEMLKMMEALVETKNL